MQRCIAMAALALLMIVGCGTGPTEVDSARNTTIAGSGTQLVTLKLPGMT